VDSEEFRARSRERWELVAPGWGASREAFQSGAVAVSAWMVEAIAPQAGHTVLELAAGPGDTGLMAAELVRPGGKLISTDGAEAMVAVAQALAEERGLADVVEARTMEAEWIDLPTASVDGVLCRWGYMLLADPEAALRETRRVLRPDGRVALACWADAADNPLIAGPGRSAALELGLIEPPPEGEPGPFALADPAALREVIEAAGFADVTLDEVRFDVRFASLDAAWEHERQMSVTLALLLPTLSPADHYRVRDAFDERAGEFAGDDGAVTFPHRTHVAVASA